MSTPSKRPPYTVVPDVHGSPHVIAGKIYAIDVERNPNTQQPKLTPRLANDKRIVLTSDEQNHIELATTDQIRVPPNVSGTYLAVSDYNKVSNWKHPTVHLYGWRDTLRKIKSMHGVLVLLSSVVASLTAIAAFAFLLTTQANPSVTTVADKAQTLFEWVRQPLDALPIYGATATQTASALQLLQTRDTDANLCLQAIEGHSAPSTTVPGISCGSVASQAWWQTTLAGSLITGILALITAGIGVLNLNNSFGFQKSPAK